ncbi:MAG: hypothetical protein A4E49_01090 [Methanosaeta sp. PtaU1.Bin112]|nr:MAG: hypothetical protein A4E49_01090 [Methanosaeta sp. PtaU1.Bin112]
MLSSLLGIRLVLWMGATVPRPAPLEVLSALASVEVNNDSQHGDGFEIKFNLTKDKLGEYNLLSSGSLEPFNRVIIGVVLGVTPEVLIDGIITRHQLLPSNEPGKSILSVSGADVSIMMNLEEVNKSHENQPDFVIAAKILASYAEYGILPQITPTTDVPIMLQRIPRQCETDYDFLQRMAKRNGYVFYIEPVTFGVNKGYWGPENRLSIPQPALSINLGEFSNINSLSFSNDSMAPAESVGSFVEPITKMSLPSPRLPSLRVPPLSRNPANARRRTIQRQMANMNPSQAASASVSASTNSPEPVEGQGELDTVKYGHVLRARGVAGVRGAGLSYNGYYYVKSVKHKIEKGEYKQFFTLSRDGTGALLPVVR